MNFITAFIAMVIGLLWLISGYMSINYAEPLKRGACGDGYIEIVTVNIMGWPARWGCVPGKYPVTP